MLLPAPVQGCATPCACAPPLQVIACSLSREEISQLKKIFKEMDKDGSGAITFPELKAGMRKLGATMPEDQLQRIMDAVSPGRSTSGPR